MKPYRASERPHGELLGASASAASASASALGAGRSRPEREVARQNESLLKARLPGVTPMLPFLIRALFYIP
ncbi:Protein of unknown function [Gryllus bimaculatus]|nr:Protein of unknown function [Gryllus bimaculatus]